MNFIDVFTMFLDRLCCFVSISCGFRVLYYQEGVKDKTEHVFQIFFLIYGVRIYPKLTESEVKIPEPDPKLENTRTGFIFLYRNPNI